MDWWMIIAFLSSSSLLLLPSPTVSQARQISGPRRTQTLCQMNCRIECQKTWHNICQKECQKKISDRMPEYRSDRMSEKMLNIYVRNDVSWWGSLEVIRIGYIKTHFLSIQNCQLIPYLGDINRNWSHTLHCFMAEKWYETPDVSRKYQFRQVS